MNAIKRYFDNKSIVLTGASKGVGLELLKRLLPYVKEIFIIDINRPTLREADYQEDSIVEKMSFIQCDVQEREQLGKIIEDILEKTSIDIVIANAGVAGCFPLQKFDYEIHDQIFKTNYEGTINTLVPFISSMVKKKYGHLVAVSTIGAHRGMLHSSSYFGAKSAIAVLLDSFRLELRPLGITITTVYPGFIQTMIAQGKNSTITPAFSLRADKAAEIILKGLAKKKRAIYFPLPMRLVTFFCRSIPDFLYDYLILKVANKERREC
jgi:short-subunit dehydrogenase